MFFPNKLSSIPVELLNINKIIIIDETSYEINNLNIECAILMFSKLQIDIGNLPINKKKYG